LRGFGLQVFNNGDLGNMRPEIKPFLNNRIRSLSFWHNLVINFQKLYLKENNNKATISEPKLTFEDFETYATPLPNVLKKLNSALLVWSAIYINFSFK
jgi:hypothetical protein